MDPLAIEFKNVNKMFYLQEDKTFKEFLPNLLLGKSWAKKFLALSELNFKIKPGETVGIVGKNGAGKSTILKLIAGVTTPTKGKVVINGKVAPLIELGAGFHHELTGYENILLNAAILGMHKKEVEAVIAQIIEFSELKEFMSVPVKKYSSGMYVRLGFSIAIYTNADIFLIDEVLAVGDAAFQKKCLNKMRELKSKHDKTIIYISHNEQTVKNFCDRAILLHEGVIVADGPPSQIFSKYHSYYLNPGIR